jgi:copper oxidase (laccase) domain-containing protein
VPFHTDAAQTVGKLPVHVDELGVDLLTVAGHKLYAPKGIGALYVRRGIRLEPLVHGGGQERGLRAGTENVAGMVALGARAGSIRAGIGPCIAQQSYEVGPEFPGHFDAASRACFVPAQRPGHFLFDLPGYIGTRLAGLGLAAVERLGCDTVADADRFFSYRRACLRGERDYGRGLAAIALDG